MLLAISRRWLHMLEKYGTYEHPRAKGLVLATAVVGISLLIRWLLWGALGDAVPFMGFFPAVIIAAYFGGLWPGLLATLLGAVAAGYFILPPRFTFRLTHDIDVVGLGLFVVTSTMISILSEAMHRGRRQLVTLERKRGEEMRRDVEERFRHIAQNIHEIFWVTNLDHTEISYVSPGYDEVWGRSSQTLYQQPRSWIENIHPEDRDAVIG